jgi:hypothetical protein
VIRRITLAATALVLLVLAVPARAQIEPPPLPVLPPPPEQLVPVFELVAPTVSPVCGNAVFAVAFGPGLVAGQLGQPLPVNVLPLFGPLVVLCGAVPAPPQRLACASDANVRLLVDTITGQAAGLPLPVDTQAVGPLAEQVIVLQDTLGPPISDTGLADMVAGTLDCRALAEAPAAEAPPPETPNPAAETDVSADEFALPDLVAGPTITAGTPELIAPTPARRAPAIRPVADVGPAFAYPVVFALPLVLLALGAYLGRALTQPVDPPQR